MKKHIGSEKKSVIILFGETSEVKVLINLELLKKIK